jgi:hypothetical protein
MTKWRVQTPQQTTQVSWTNGETRWTHENSEIRSHEIGEGV